MGVNVMDDENEPSNSQKETAGENTCQDENDRSFVNAEEGTTTNTWTGPATKLLLEKYKKRIERFRNPKVKKVTLWREIEVVLKAKKLNFDTTTIQGKFRNMKHTYGKIKKNNSRKTTGAGRLSWPWLNDMEDIFHDDKSINFSTDEVISSMVDKENSPMNLSVSNESSLNSTESSPDSVQETSTSAECLEISTSTSSSSRSGRSRNNRNLYYQRQKQFDVDTIKLDILKNLGEKLHRARKVRETSALLQAQRTSELTDAINARTEVLKGISMHLKLLLDRSKKSDDL